jgi:hypothetical protein
MATQRTMMCFLGACARTGDGPTSLGRAPDAGERTDAECQTGKPDHRRTASVPVEQVEGRWSEPRDLGRELEAGQNPTLRSAKALRPLADVYPK